MQEAQILTEMCEALVHIAGRHGVRPRTLVDLILDVAEGSNPRPVQPPAGAELNYHTTEREPVTLRRRGRPATTDKGEEVMINDPQFVDVAVNVGFPREIATQLKTRGWSQSSTDPKTHHMIVRRYKVESINETRTGRPVRSLETPDSVTPGQRQSVPVSTILSGLDPETKQEPVKPPRPQRVSKPQ